MTLPEDPFMLLSLINMKLRDEGFKTFEEMCDSYGWNEEEIRDKLKNAGFEYIQDLNQFK